MFLVATLLVAGLTNRKKERKGCETQQKNVTKRVLPKRKEKSAGPRFADSCCLTNNSAASSRSSRLGSGCSSIEPAAGTAQEVASLLLQKQNKKQKQKHVWPPKSFQNCWPYTHPNSTLCGKESR